MTKEIFEIDNQSYNFQDKFTIKRHKVCLLYYGTEKASSIGPKIWDALANGSKDATSLKSFRILKGGFKENIKRWIPENCPCRWGKTTHFTYLHITFGRDLKV